MGDYNDAFMRNQNAAVQARVKPPQNRANIQQLKLVRYFRVFFLNSVIRLFLSSSC